MSHRPKDMGREIVLWPSLEIQSLHSGRASLIIILFFLNIILVFISSTTHESMNFVVNFSKSIRKHVLNVIVKEVSDNIHSTNIY